jgi:hypothetical protein
MHSRGLTSRYNIVNSNNNTGGLLTTLRKQHVITASLNIQESQLQRIDLFAHCVTKQRFAATAFGDIIAEDQYIRNRTADFYWCKSLVLIWRKNIHLKHIETRRNQKIIPTEEAKSTQFRIHLILDLWMGYAPKPRSKAASFLNWSILFPHKK